MERLSDRAIDIVNELHRERLDYTSEYVPLIDALQKLSAYEDAEPEPDEERIFDTVVRWWSEHVHCNECPANFGSCGPRIGCQERAREYLDYITRY